MGADMNDLSSAPQPEGEHPKMQRKPDWIRVKAPVSKGYQETRKLMRELNLHTVCEEAACPNIGECWDRGTATFMILGDTCTRACSYCNVKTGWPNTVDLAEPIRVASTVKQMGLNYTVITSVDRDDLPDYGSGIFEQTITQVKRTTPDCKIEVLIPDFEGDFESLERVVTAGPHVLNHNIESTVRIFPKVRPKGSYDLSLELLAKAKDIKPATVTKSGIIVGMGETVDEILETIANLRKVDCDLLPIGQYLRP